MSESAKAYRHKAQRVMAYQSQEDGMVQDKEGASWRVEKGAWVVTSEDQKQFVLSDEAFRAEYEPDGPEDSLPAPLPAPGVPEVAHPMTAPAAPKLDPERF